MKRLRNVFKSEAGFTLIELLIVIAVLGILAGIAVPRITGVRTEAERASLQSNATSIRNTIEMYIAQTGEMPNSLTISSGTIDLGTDLNLTISGLEGLTISGYSSESVDGYSFDLVYSDEDDPSNPTEDHVTIEHSGLTTSWTP